MSDYIPLDIMCPIPQGRNSDDMGMPSPVIKERVMTTQTKQDEELVKRLEHFCSLHKGMTPESWAMNEAAATITRLTREVKELTERYGLEGTRACEAEQAVEALRQQLAEALASNGVMREALGGMLTHMGMDEDEWNKPTFDKARAALATPSPTALAEHDAEVRRKALEEVVTFAAKKGWGMKDDSPFEEAVMEVCEEVVRMAAEKGDV